MATAKTKATRAKKSAKPKRTIARVGMRVHVWSANQSKDWGLGTITKVEWLVIKETGDVISRRYPSRIELDIGRVTEGMKCWWSPVGEHGHV